METVIQRNCLGMRGQYSGRISGESRHTMGGNSDVNTEHKMPRTISTNDSDSDPIFSGESSDDSPRGRKRSAGSQYTCEGSKRVRQDTDPVTVNHNDEMAESADSLFGSQSSFRNSQLSYAGDLNSSQPVGLINSMPGYCNQPASENVAMYSSQPSTTARYAVNSNHRVYRKGKRATNNKRVTKGKQSRSSSQDSNANEVEVSKEDKQKAKNRRYARDSRDRKNKKMFSLEQANKLQRSVIEIYIKVIGIVYKRHNPGAILNWAKFHIPWYSNTDGESGKFQTVECILPVEDKAFFEELGNAPIGTIIAKDSPARYPEDLPVPDSITTRGSNVAMTSNSGSIFTHRTVPNPASNLLRTSQTTNYPPSLHHGATDYTQNPSAKLESTDCTGGRHNGSEDMLHFPTLANAVKPEPYETVGQGGFNSVQIASSQTSIVSPDTCNLMPNRQITTDMNNPSSATTSTEHISVTTYFDRNFNGNRLPRSGSNFMATQTGHKLSSDVPPATVNILPDAPSSLHLSAQNYEVSRGNDFNTAIPETVIYIEQSENEPGCRYTAGGLLLPTPQYEEEEKPVNLKRSSSLDSLPDVEDLQSSLETA